MIKSNSHGFFIDGRDTANVIAHDIFTLVDHISDLVFRYADVEVERGKEVISSLTYSDHPGVRMMAIAVEEVIKVAEQFKRADDAIKQIARMQEEAEKEKVDEKQKPN